jgi:SAM-dependent methyltransferase
MPYNAGMIAEFFIDRAACPRCHGDLNSKGGQLHCAACRVRFPNFNAIPWLFPHPEAAWADWRHRLEYQVQTMAMEFNLVGSALAAAPSPAARARLTRLREALEVNAAILRDLLKPLLGQGKFSLPLFEAVKSQLPLNQKLMGYYANLHRDWAWGDAEHEASFRLLRKIAMTEKWGRVLVLGAGAGRLAFDIAHTGAELAVALDINPLLVAFGERLTSGQTLRYAEFPVGPLSENEAAVVLDCKAPRPPSDKLIWLLADGMNPPFKEKSFDAVVTAWFIDVIPQRLDSLGRKINNVLKDGGAWLNFGPYGFLGSPYADQFSPQEILDIAIQAGFKIQKNEFQTVPYLQSPYSAQRREERLFAFGGEKIRHLEAGPRFRHYPEWFEDLTAPVPLSEKTAQYAFATQVQGQVLGLIDGRRGLSEIAKAFGGQHGLGEEESLGAVVSLLRRLWDGV